jgi:hypothetical protein
VVQKYIAAVVVLVLLSLNAPAFAGEFVNRNLPSNRVPLFSLAPTTAVDSSVLIPRAALGNLGVFAVAPPQSGQGQTPASKPKTGALTTKGRVFKWVGIGLMAEGAFSGLYGAAVLSDPCSGMSGRYVSCTSNYTTVRATWFGICAASVVTGAILLVKGLHSRE